MTDSIKDEESRLFQAQMKLLNTSTEHQNTHEITGVPIFTTSVRNHAPESFTQYAFLCGDLNIMAQNQAPVADTPETSVVDLITLDQDSPTGPNGTRPFKDPRLFFNIAAPSSAFICGSQGSGKSHTLSCLLENCLVKSDVSKLDRPLAGLVFHYDAFTSDLKGIPCEAAYLSSDPNITVRVLCSPANIATIMVSGSSHFVDVG